MNKTVTLSITGILLLSLIFSCKTENELPSKVNSETHIQDKEECRKLLEKHLDAVSNRDISTLSSTLAPHGRMQLILPKMEIIHDADKFIDFHREWFQDSLAVWTFDTKITSLEVSEKYAIAVTEIIYKEPERDGVPYSNRQAVSYALEKIDDQWYVILDHCSSIEKSTDK